MKKSKITILSLALIIAVLASAFFGYRYMKKVISAKAEAAKAAERIEKGRREQEQYIASQAINDINACNKYQDAAAKKCLAQVLGKYSSSSIEICGKLAAANIAKHCRDWFEIKRIISANKPAECSTLGEDFKSACIDTLSMSYRSVKDCDEMDAEDKQRCLDLANYKIAISSSSPDLCSRIKSSSLLDDCQRVQTNKPHDSDNDGVDNQMERSLGLDPDKADTDDDGLSDGDEVNQFHTDAAKRDTDDDTLSDKNEILLGTSPSDKDTDKDGYSDADEIAKGFNPCGEGKLPDSEELKKDCQKISQ